jgi:hypothetical protein
MINHNWIPLKKVYPSFLVNVLIWIEMEDDYEGGQCYTAYYQKYSEPKEGELLAHAGWFPSNVEWPDCTEKTKIKRNVTHWMPLPDGPKNG